MWFVVQGVKGTEPVRWRVEAVNASQARAAAEAAGITEVEVGFEPAVGGDGRDFVAAALKLGAMGCLLMGGMGLLATWGKPGIVPSLLVVVCGIGLGIWGGVVEILVILRGRGGK